MHRIVIYCKLLVLYSVLRFSSTFSTDNILDMTYRFRENETLFWPGQPKFLIKKVWDYRLEDVEYYFKVKEFSAAEHGGTHMDAPIHFTEGGWSLHEIPVENFVGPGVRIDVTEKTAENPLALVAVEDITNWERKHGAIPEDAVVLLYTGRGKEWPNESKYFGKNYSQLNFPGLDPTAAKWLVENRNIVGVGIDTPSIDNGASKTFETHVVLGKAGIYILENVANMDKLPGPKGFTIVALPMKIYEGTGAPARVVALIGESTTSDGCRAHSVFYYVLSITFMMKMLIL